MKRWVGKIKSDELYHYGVKGQKWGERRWQYKDGSLTPEGYVHYGYGGRRNRSEQSIPKNTKHLKNYDGPAYFISESPDFTSLTPRVPNNYFTKNGYEDSETNRVSFALSIGQCLAGLSQNVEGKTYYVYSPDDISKYNVFKPNTKAVPDSKITDELWICEPVKLKQVDKIVVTGNEGKDGVTFNYGNSSAELYDDWIYERA